MSYIENLARTTEFLRTVAPWVILCGSQARDQATPLSDYDFFVRQKPQPEDEEPSIDTSYLPDIIEKAKEFGYEIDSCIIGSITLGVETTGSYQLEFSSLYRLPIGSPIGVKTIFGIDFLTCEDDKNARFEDCYDVLDDLGEVTNPLPPYEEEITKFRDRGII